MENELKTDIEKLNIKRKFCVKDKKLAGSQRVCVPVYVCVCERERQCWCCFGALLVFFLCANHSASRSKHAMHAAASS